MNTETNGHAVHLVDAELERLFVAAVLSDQSRIDHVDRAIDIAQRDLADPTRKHPRLCDPAWRPW